MRSFKVCMMVKNLILVYAASVDVLDGNSWTQGCQENETANFIFIADSYLIELLKDNYLSEFSVYNLFEKG